MDKLEIKGNWNKWKGKVKQAYANIARYSPAMFVFYAIGYCFFFFRIRSAIIGAGTKTHCSRQQGGENNCSNWMGN